MTSPHASVVERAARRAGSHEPLPAGVALGIATNQAHGSYVAVVARVAKKDGTIVIEKLTCVADCGLAVSPGDMEERIYGGLMWGLGHASFDQIDIHDGRVVQHNFDTFRVARMSDMPVIDIDIVQGGLAKPGGVGELSSPAVTPAIANAIYRLTGERKRSTPFDMAIKRAGPKTS